VSVPEKGKYTLLYRSAADLKKARREEIADADLVGYMDGKFVKIVKHRGGRAGVVTTDEWATLIDRTEAYRRAA
jgi:replicative DNA helicase